MSLSCKSPWYGGGGIGGGGGRGGGDVGAGGGGVLKMALVLDLFIFDFYSCFLHVFYGKYTIYLPLYLQKC